MVFKTTTITIVFNELFHENMFFFFQSCYRFAKYFNCTTRNFNKYIKLSTSSLHWSRALHILVLKFFMTSDDECARFTATSTVSADNTIFLIIFAFNKTNHFLNSVLTLIYLSSGYIRSFDIN